MSNDISFKMKINFVDAKAFAKIKGGVYIDWQPPHKVVSKYNEWADLGLKSIIKRQDIVHADEFRTANVRTCTGGGIIDLKNSGSSGFHYYDDKTNYNNIVDFLKKLFEVNKNPDSAFVIGGKNLLHNEYSLPIMNTILEIFKLKIPKVTYFCEHGFPYSETDFHYSRKDDTLTICSMFRSPTELTEHHVSSPEDLKKCYKRIHIADGDELYINEKKVEKEKLSGANN